MPSAAARPEVFSAGEIAEAAGVPVERVREALYSHRFTRADRFVGGDHAVAIVRALRAGQAASTPARPLFVQAAAFERRPAGALAASGSLHGLFLAGLLLLASLGAGEPAQSPAGSVPRLVFLAGPGPGGGGGGGGLSQPLPAPPAAVRGTTALRSPVSVAVARREAHGEPRDAAAPARLPEPPRAEPDSAPVPPLSAPVASVPSDELDRAGTTEESSASVDSHGPGEGGGTGGGHGSGDGVGRGAGLGNGSIAGVGGGPYRPGAGITPPTLLVEVRPAYTEDARRRGIEGEVVMEAVIRSDGTVGSMRVIRGPGAGLEKQAIEAVRQWKFAPARRHGTPVDVLVEVAVEFRMR